MLLLGWSIAGGVWWAGQNRTPANDPYATILADNSKMQTHQMQLLYGKMGLLDLADDIKQPGPQAAFIAVISAAVAFGCFHFARLRDEDAADR